MANAVMNFPGGLEKAVTLSYDDGVEQDIQLVSVLDRYGIKCTFNINTGKFAPEGKVYAPGTINRRMTERAVVELLSGSNHEVAVHALTHPHLENLSQPCVVNEVMADRLNIERLFGKITRGMAYPYGTYNDSVVEALRVCGIAYSRTVGETENFGIPEDWLRLNSTCHHTSKNLPVLTDKFISEKKPGTEPWLFYLWGHSYEFERDNNWSVIEDFAEKVGRRDDIWYATNIEVYDYVSAYRSLIYSADGRAVYNPTSQTVFLSVGSTRFCIAPGETVRL